MYKWDEGVLGRDVEILAILLDPLDLTAPPQCLDVFDGIIEVCAQTTGDVFDGTWPPLEQIQYILFGVLVFFGPAVVLGEGSDNFGIMAEHLPGVVEGFGGERPGFGLCGRSDDSI